LIDVKNRVGDKNGGGLAEGMAKSLEGIRQLLDSVDDVVIEKQPGRNLTMVRAEAYIQMYFTMLGKRVTLFSASKKLALTDCNFKGGGRDKYKLRKKAAIKVVTEYIQKNGSVESRELFENSSKKDDLADCMLQALSYVGWRPVCEPKSHQEAWSNGVTQKERVLCCARSRKPSEEQSRTGTFSLSNIRYFWQSKEGGIGGFEDRVREINGLHASIVKFFGTTERCMTALRETSCSILNTTSTSTSTSTSTPEPVEFKSLV
jgi:hypothetical protein